MAKKGLSGFSFEANPREYGATCLKAIISFAISAAP